MFCKFFVVGTVHQAPKRVDDRSIVFRVIAIVGTFEPRKIVVTVTAHDDLAKRFVDLKRGARVIVDGEPKTTREGNPYVHTYSDGQPYALYEITARKIQQVKSLA